MLRQLLKNRENWDQPAVIHGDDTISYRALSQKAAAVTHHLLHNPPATSAWRPGHTAILLPNDETFIAAFYGTLMAGKIAVPLSTHLTRYEIAPLLHQTSTTMLITSTAYRPMVEELKAAMDSEASLEVLWMEELPHPALVTEGDGTSGPNTLAVQQAGTPDPNTLAVQQAGTSGPNTLAVQQAGPPGPNTPAVLLATSGTTGNAKIVQLSEHNIDTCVLGYIEKMDYRRYQKDQISYILATPFSAVYGIMMVAACLKLSCPIVLLEENFTLSNLYETIQNHHVTHYEGGAMTAILMDRMAGRPHPYNISSLGYFGCGGSRVSGETFARLLQAYPGVEFWAGYGMTEASPLIAKPDKKVPPDKLASAGTAIRGLTIRVEVDGVLTDTPFLEGEIAVRGPSVMLGYYENEAATRSVIKHGFLYTGDIGYLDEDGWLYICGRKKNVVITRGFNVYPEEVETCLLDSRFVKDCHVYGETDSQGNEIVCADIISTDPGIGEEEIRSFLNARLSAAKRPRRILLVRELPKTPTGKNRKQDKEPQL